jgi:hypothetical protein
MDLNRFLKNGNFSYHAADVLDFMLGETGAKPAGT